MNKQETAFVLAGLQCLRTCIEAGTVPYDAEVWFNFAGVKPSIPELGKLYTKFKDMSIEQAVVPFALPLVVEDLETVGTRLEDATGNFICHMPEATPPELDFILKAVNFHA